MTNLTDTANRPSAGFDVSSLDRTDRLLLGGCVVAWLAALGAGVAAIVALIDLGRGHTAPVGDSGTPWVLYTIIGVSAAVIVAAIPLLLRARRDPDAELTPVEKRLARQQAERTEAAPARPVDAPTEKLRMPPPPADTNSGRLPRILQSPVSPTVIDSPAVDRVWLRNTASVTGAMGVATVLVSAATYLMAVDSVTASWVLYGVAGAVTAAMVAIPVYFLRELRAALGS